MSEFDVTNTTTSVQLVSPDTDLFITRLLKQAKELGATYVEVRVGKIVVKLNIQQESTF